MAKLLHSIPALAASLMLAAPPTNSKMSPRLFSGAKTQQSAIDAEVQKITKSAILIDTHNDIPSFTVDGADIGTSTSTMTNIARLRQGGVGAVFFSVYVASKYVDGNHSAHRALEMTIPFATTSSIVIPIHSNSPSPPT